jgi:hypothetical protein
MSIILPFNPSSEQIKAATVLLVAMANQAVVEPIVLAYQREILVRHQWRINQKYAEPFGEQIITAPSRSYLLSDEDATVYFSECKKAAEEAGLKVRHPGNCPLLEAKSIVIDARRDIVAAMEPNTGITWDLLMRDFLAIDEYIDLTLRLMTPFVPRSQNWFSRASFIAHLDGTNSEF